MTVPPLEFDPVRHAYSIGATEYPGVTQVLKSAGIIDDRWYTEESRELGKRVAIATAQDDRDQFDQDAADPLLRQYVQAWRRFKADSGAEMIRVEVMFADRRLGYAGTADRIAAGPTGRACGEVLLDIKTGAFAAWHAVQLAAYRHGILGANSHDLTGCANVYLREDGTYKYRPVTPDEERRGWQVFQAALAIHKWKGG